MSAVPLPSQATLVKATEIAMRSYNPSADDDDEMPGIFLDYWPQSLNKQCFIAYYQTTEGGKPEVVKCLAKDSVRFTSPIQKIYQAPGAPEYIIQTQNNIYIVSATIPTRKANKPLGSSQSE